MPQSTDELTVTGKATFNGKINASNDALTAQTRATVLQQDANVRFPIDLTTLCVWDAVHTPLPGTAAADDLALVGGTFGTAPPTVQAGDLKAAGATTRYARFAVIVPECYDAGQTVQLLISCGMKTTIADTSCTLDLECYKSDKLSGVGSDLCTTAAMTINSLTFSEKTFTITSSGLVAGDVLDVRIAIACNDAATATAVIPTISNIDRTFDIKG
jgi:hypothetical protein